MAVLTIGRVGLDVELPHPSEWSESARIDSGREIAIRGFLLAADSAQTSALRTELLEQMGKLTPVTYTLDPLLNGFYILTETRIDSLPVSYRGRGVYPFEVLLYRVGSDSRTELQSLLTAATVTNSHSITAQYWHATPPAALAYNVGSGAPLEKTRTTEDGAIAVYLDIPAQSDPTWSVAPGSYYGGAARLYTAGRLRAGQDFTNTAADWSLENGLIRIRPVPYQGTSTGELDLYVWSSGWSSNIRWKILWSGTTKIPKWHYMTCIRNDPEVVVIRLVRDAETSPPSAFQHQLDLTLRRGAPYVSCYYKYTGGASTHAVARDSVDAATGATGYIKDTGTISGHRWVLGTPQAHTQDTTNGKITPTVSSQYFKFWIGAAVSDAADGSGHGPADIAKQYMGWVGETVRAVRR